MRASHRESIPPGISSAAAPAASPSLPPILFGSHIDSVPNGGNFDGDLGSLSALGAMEGLATAALTTRHPLEMVIWAHEEGVAFGRGLACSRIVAGDITPADLDQVWNGMRRADGIRKIGGDPDRILEARKSRGAYHAYVELHIEQGGTLEKAGLQIGVVAGHCRHRSIRRRHHRICQSCGHHTDGRTARRAAGRIAPHHRRCATW